MLIELWMPALSVLSALGYSAYWFYVGEKDQGGVYLFVACLVVVLCLVG